MICKELYYFWFINFLQMKKLYFLFFLTIGLLANAQIVNIPDANFKAKLLSAISTNNIASTQTPIYDGTTDSWSVSSYNVIDTNSDGEIQVTEAQAIKWLDVSGGSYINNIEGIEAFSNLQVLICEYIELPTLDASSLTNLIFLNCNFNQLTNLNLSTNTALINLGCQSNLLTNLDVSTNSALVYLDCSNNELTTLDVSPNPMLSHLECFVNQLVSLNVANENNTSFSTFNAMAYGRYFSNRSSVFSGGVS